jgi:hypothetical protein
VRVPGAGLGKKEQALLEEAYHLRATWAAT